MQAVDKARRYEVEHTAVRWAVGLPDAAGLPLMPVPEASPLFAVPDDGKPTERWSVGLDLPLTDPNDAFRVREALGAAPLDAVELEATDMMARVNFVSADTPLRESGVEFHPWILHVGLTVLVVSADEN